MKHRMSRSHKKRATFKVDSLYDQVKTKNKDFLNILPGFMNLTFLGFYDKNIDASIKQVQIETVLFKISHKKRKDSSSPLMEASFGLCDVDVNPPHNNLPPMAPSVSVPSEAFTISADSLAKSYVLLLKVQHSIKSDANCEDDEPAAKKRKSLTNGTLEKNSNSNNTEMKLYVSELVVYDKHSRCLLSDADYELMLQEVKGNCNKNSPRKHSTWESSDDLVDCCTDLDALFMSPSVKFKLNWSAKPCDKMVERPVAYPTSETKEIAVNNNANQEKLQIVYQFVYNNNSRQQTEACEDLHCPWCSLNCQELYVLLKHLKLCHSRFTFTYVPISVGARIDVAINELYDGSYTGSPHDLINQPSVYAFSRNGPVRRASVTHILVCHPKRSKPSLSEFLELDDCEYDGQRPFITGHNRLYHHTATCLPIYPKEMEIDSEGENDPEWLRSKTMQMIDEFTDVNEGEKELMKMWNLHVMKYGFVGDCQIPLACAMFVEHKGKELLLKNLYRNFVVHMCSLFDFGLVSAVCLYNTLKKLQEMVRETAAIRAVLRESREAQMDNWHKAGITSPIFNPDKPGPSKTPTNRKNIGIQRRKGTPQPATEPPLRRKSLNAATESTKKRLSLKQPEKNGN